jgi:hypothetical protein
LVETHAQLRQRHNGRAFVNHATLNTSNLMIL